MRRERQSVAPYSVRTRGRFRSLTSTPPDILNILLVGQSVINDLTTAHSNAGGLALIAEAQAKGYTTVNIVNGCKDGAAVAFAAAGGAGAYLASGDATKGTVYTTELDNAVTASGLAKSAFTKVIVMIGNTDAAAINAATITEAQHKTAFTALLNILKTDFPNADIIAVENIKDQSTEFTGWYRMRKAQWEVRNELSFVEESPAFYDIQLEADGTHPASAGTTVMGQRWARLCAGIDGHTSRVGTVGAKVVSGTWDDVLSRAFLTIQHDGGTDFTIGVDEIGFTYFVNGTATNPFNDTLLRVDPTTFRFNFSAAVVSGATVQANWLYGSGRNLVRTGVLMDNNLSPLPLKDFYNLTLTELAPEIQNVVVGSNNVVVGANNLIL